MVSEPASRRTSNITNIDVYMLVSLVKHFKNLDAPVPSAVAFTTDDGQYLDQKGGSWYG